MRHCGYCNSTNRQSTGLPENGEFQEHIRMPAQALIDSVLFFKSFFWNSTYEEFECTGLKAFLYND